MLIVSRPSRIWSRVAIPRASMAGWTSPQRTAASKLIFSVWGGDRGRKGQGILADLIRRGAQNIAKAEFVGR